MTNTPMKDEVQGRTGKIIELFPSRERYPRRFYGECQRCQRADYLPWATEHGVRYCGHCYEADAISYVKRANP